jgi:hypothetical protein
MCMDMVVTSATAMKVNTVAIMAENRDSVSHDQIHHIIARPTIRK